MENKYLFKSERLGFRNWLESDKAKMVEINRDPEVMKYFTSVPTEKQTSDFVERMKKQFAENGFCYFAVDKLDTKQFIGFIGLAKQTYEASFTACVDIGWRLSRAEWNKGYATEGAKSCLEFASQQMDLKSIKSVCPERNLPSEKVMIKIGLSKVMNFNHPLLSDRKELESCVLYEIDFP